MTDHRIAAVETAEPLARDGHSSLPRLVLWLLLAVSLVVNGSLSIAGVAPIVSAGFGVLAIVCAVLLVRQWRAGRSR